MTTIVPPMKWAQRKESVFITVTIPGVTDPKVDVSSSSLTFSGVANEKNYAVTLDFFKEINPDKSKWSCTPRCVQFHLKKDNEETWTQLLKDKNQYKNLLKIDWDLWADSDEEEEADNFNLPPNFQSLMQNMNAGNMAMPEDDECGCGHDHCGCGHDHCACEHDHDDSSDSDSAFEDSDDLPPLEEVN